MDDLRERLGAARLVLLFTPELCGAREPLDVLAAALPWIDVVQVRTKAADARTSAREAADWTLRVLELVERRAAREVLVLANDRVDVARVLLGRGCAGVHLGQDDCPPRVAREVLGREALIGLSTHGAEQIARALEEPVDYLGFGPVHATRTKGYERGLGAEAAWIAHESSPLPVFPIGGIRPENVGELAEIGRAAVSSAVLGAEDPAAAARALREALAEDD